MRSMATRARLAISAGTRTSGAIFSRQEIMLSSVMVFMNAQTALGFTG